MHPFHFLLNLDDDRIVQAIRHAEQQTSGEIRVFISRNHVDNPVAAAQQEFERLGMTATRERNGVLIFIAPRSRNFAIVGDQGVHARCGQSFWSSVAAAMEQDFRNELMTDAIVLGIAKAGELLSQHFPRRTDDVNELSDAVERG